MKKRILGFATILAALLGPAATSAFASLPPSERITFNKDKLALSQTACASNPTGSAVRVNIVGLRNRNGLIRVQLYNGTADEFLEKGRWLVRMQGPAAASGVVSTCMPLQKVGASYGIVVRHDGNGNGKSDLSDDGYGFSNNPKLGLAKPKVDKVVFTARPGVSEITVVMNYLSGLSMKPIKTEQD